MLKNNRIYYLTNLDRVTYWLKGPFPQYRNIELDVNWKFMDNFQLTSVPNLEWLHYLVALLDATRVTGLDIIFYFNDLEREFWHNKITTRWISCLFQESQVAYNPREDTCCWTESWGMFDCNETVSERNGYFSRSPQSCTKQSHRYSIVLFL